MANQLEGKQEKFVEVVDSPINAGSGLAPRPDDDRICAHTRRSRGVVFATYKVLGQDLNSLVNKVDGLLTAT